VIYLYLDRFRRSAQWSLAKATSALHRRPGY